MSDALKQHREQIDAIDLQLLQLVNARAQHAHAIGTLKGGDPIYRPEREAQVLRRLHASNAGPLPDAEISTIFRGIMSACRALEKQLAVAFLGPQGTYSEEAAIKHFGTSFQPLASGSIDEAMRLVEAGQADYCVVPVENSTEGAIGRTLDLLTQTPLTICGEIMLPVHHCLLSHAERLEDVRQVYAHAQSLAQCHAWLNQHLTSATTQAVVSNAEAALLANAQGKATAAIASARAADLFGLPVLARHIADDPRNTTRFLVLSQHPVAASGKDKTSLLLAAKNVPGAIVALLQPFAEHGVSLTRLESRPSRTGVWEYVFFIDVEGHLSDPPVQKSLQMLTEKASLLKLLGSYPQAVV